MTFCRWNPEFWILAKFFTIMFTSVLAIRWVPKSIDLVIHRISCQDDYEFC